MNCNFFVQLVEKIESELRENSSGTFCSPSFTEYLVKISQLSGVGSGCEAVSVYIFSAKMSVYILPYNVKLKGKNKPFTAENFPPYTTFYALSSLKVSRRLDLLISNYGQNKRQNGRLQSV